MICDTANGMDSCNKTVMEQELARALLRYRERYGLLQLQMGIFLHVL